MKSLIVFFFLISITICEYDRRVITSLKYSKYKHNRVAPTIVHGEPATNNQVPYLASLKQPDVINLDGGVTLWRNMCGATIVTETAILTAAHCFELNDFYYAKYPGILRCVAGNTANTIEHTGHTVSTPEGQWRTLTKVHLHERFVFPHNDIAIGVVDMPFIFTSTVQPINLASQNMDYKNNCIAAGYGRLGPTLRDSISPVLLVAPITVIPRTQCSLMWDMDMNSFICTDTRVTDVARGDSGGPLVCNATKDIQENPGKGILVGVVSGKSADTTTLFTRVSAYRNWFDDWAENQMYIAIFGDNSSKLFVNRFLLIIPLLLIYLEFYYLFYYPINL